MERDRIIGELLETTQERFWNIDNDGRTIDLNPAMCGILDRSRDEIMGKNIYEFVDAENEAIFHTELEKRRYGHTGPYEVALQRPDGTNFPCITTATPIFEDDGVKIGSIGLWTDISAQKKIAAAGVAQTKLIEFLQTVSTLANEALEPAKPCGAVCGRPAGSWGGRWGTCMNVLRKANFC